MKNTELVELISFISSMGAFSTVLVDPENFDVSDETVGGYAQVRVLIDSMLNSGYIERERLAEAAEDAASDIVRDHCGASGSHVYLLAVSDEAAVALLSEIEQAVKEVIGGAL